MTVKANVTFTHTDDPYLRDVEFDVLPREGEDLAIMPSGTAGHHRIDRVSRVRHFITDDDGHHIELILDAPGTEARQRLRTLFDAAYEHLVTARRHSADGLHRDADWALDQVEHCLDDLRRG